MKIRMKEKVLDVYFLVSHKIWWNEKWTPFIRVITKKPDIQGIRVHIPEFPEFGEISATNFNFHQIQDDENVGPRYWYSIVPFESADIS
jgi:hypothetical protein